MKKYLKMFVVFAMAICSCFSLFGCKDNTPPKAPETEEKTFTAQQHTALKSAIAKTTDENVYKNGYTLTSAQKNKVQFTIDEENFNPQGTKWTPEYKKTYIDGLKDNFKKMEEESNNIKEITSFNATNKTGYKVTYSYDNENKATLEDFDKVVAEDGGYNLYHYYRRESTPDKEKYTVDENYYKNYIVEYSDESAICALDVFNQENIDTLKAILDYEFSEMQSAQTTLTYIEENGEYIVYVDMSAAITETMNMMGVPLTTGTVEEIITIKFDNDGIKNIDINTAMNGDIIMPVSGESDDPDTPADTITINVDLTMDMGYEYSMSYNAEYLPAFDDTIKAEDFTLQSQKGIKVKYYVNGYKYTRDNYSFGDSVSTLSILNDTQVANPTNVKWYLDPECTQEFTATTYPSHNINLYTKVTPIEGRALVKYKEVSSEAGLAYGKFDLLGEYVYFGNVNYGTVDATKYTCAYVNGVKVNAGETMTLNPSIVNFVIYVKVAEEE